MDETVATVVFDDCHDAVLVRSAVDPSDIVTVAVNCDWPVVAKLDVPETLTLDTVGAGGTLVVVEVVVVVVVVVGVPLVGV